MDLLAYIKKWAENRYIERYELKDKVLTINDVNKNVKLANGTAFIYEIYAAGQITSVENLNGEFIVAETATEYYNLKNMVEIKDFGTFQAAKVNFIFSTENSVKFTLLAGVSNALFQTITNLHIKYMYLTKLANK